jgi:hypothetical protein
MEDIDLSKSIFTYKGIIPSNSDEITTQWGRRLAYNLFNGYGIVGKFKIQPREFVFIQIDLSAIYTVCPRVTLYWQYPLGIRTAEDSSTGPFSQDDAWLSVSEGENLADELAPNKKELNWSFDGHCLVVESFLPITAIVLYRINGV